MHRYTIEEKQDLLQRVGAFRKDGMSIHNACKEAGIAKATYVSWDIQSRRGKIARPKLGRPRKATPTQLLTLPMIPNENHEGQRLAMFVGDDETILRIYKSLFGRE